eukprot:CAMPEP_0198239906 /NCGR_PEP_ID=MMETSP1446-20131203/5179_1 /TAXON_ID=1461542 ORGANISM="Unidentified sp, Strain CCMP2111" /NCGR_SAMPLE_ID=MMETSP1446 /ASSEMBLY_ACC=CAM_ASM_001112 /LENGTH=618 /DNA_ID=CAMNT_0043922573 /DNA_START=454 /DNA_END=2310 /DNA_ORIENTATION=+
MKDNVSAFAELLTKILAPEDECSSERAKGKVVGILARTSLEGSLAILSVLEAGLVGIPVNWRWSDREASLALDKNNADIILCDSASQPLATGVASRLGRAVPLISVEVKGNKVLLNLVNSTDDRPTRADGSGDSGNVPTGTEPSSWSWILDPNDRFPEDGSTFVEGDGRMLRYSSSSTAVILFTSGTTSFQPKGVRLTHLAFWAQAVAKISLLGYCSDDVHLHLAPLYHVSGLCALMTALNSQAKRHVFLPSFSPEGFVKAVQEHGVTSVLAVPAMIMRIHKHLSSVSHQVHQGETNDSEAASALDSVKIVLLGGDVVDGSLAQICADMFPCADIFATYGMTEACSSISIRAVVERTFKRPLHVVRDAAEPNQNQTSAGLKLEGTYVGLVAPHMDVGVVGGDDGSVSHAPMVLGELAIRGPSVCLPLSLPSSSGNWVETGDLGWLDARGGLFLSGRKSDAIRSGAEMVHPSDVERHLAEHEAVTEVAVFGVPDEVLGEKVCALVVLRGNGAHTSWSGLRWEGNDVGDGGSVGVSGQPSDVDPGSGGPSFKLSPSLLKDHLVRSGLTSYKVPKVFVASTRPLPRNAMGKVNRASVRSEIRQLLVKEGPTKAEDPAQNKA